MTLCLVCLFFNTTYGDHLLFTQERFIIHDARINRQRVLTYHSNVSIKARLRQIANECAIISYEQFLIITSSRIQSTFTSISISSISRRQLFNEMDISRNFISNRNQNAKARELQ